MGGVRWLENHPTDVSAAQIYAAQYFIEVKLEVDFGAHRRSHRAALVHFCAPAAALGPAKIVRVDGPPAVWASSSRQV